MAPARSNFWKVFEDRDGDTKEQRLYKARARLERKLVLMPTGVGRCLLDDDEEEKHRMLATARDLPESFIKRSVEGMLDEGELAPATEAQAEQMRKRRFRRKFRDLYYSWMKNAENPEHWMELKHMLRYFQFARSRPLMTEWEFHEFLRDLGVYTDYCDRVKKERQKENENDRHRDLLIGKYRDNTKHPSTVYSSVLPRGQGHRKHPQAPSLDLSMPRQFDGGHNELKATSGEDVSESTWKSGHCSMSQTVTEICDTIKNFRRGRYKLEEIEAAIGDHLAVTSFRIKEYASKIKDPTCDPEKLASGIFMNALWLPLDCDKGDLDDGVQSPDADTVEQVEDIANAIILFRRGHYSLKETKAAIRGALEGLRYFMSSYVPLIKDHSRDATYLAKHIYDEALEESEGSEGQDDDEDSQDTSRIGASAGLAAVRDTHNVTVTGRTLGTGREVLKVNFSASSQLAAIYQDVLHGHLDVVKAPFAFRKALNKPAMLTSELSTILYQNNIPSDMFFSSEQIAPGFSRAWESNPGSKHVRFTEDPLDNNNNKDTPPHSRKSSAEVKIAAEPDPKYPDTPPLHPDDGMPQFERASVLDHYIIGKLTDNLLSSATQKHAEEPAGIDCLYEDDEEAEVPEPWHESAPDDSHGGGCDEAEVHDHSGGEVTEDWGSDVSEEGEIKEPSKPTAINTSMKIVLDSMSSNDLKSTNTSIERVANLIVDEGIPIATHSPQEEKVIGEVSSSPVEVISSGPLPPQPSATPATANTTTTEPRPAGNTEVKSNGSSMGPPPIPVKRTPRPQKRKAPYGYQPSGTIPSPEPCPDRPSEDDRRWKAQVGYQNMEEIYMDLRDSSPEDGETEDLHGVRMSTKNAQELALKYRLPRDFVEKLIRSDTPERVPYKKARKASSVQSVPTLKCRRVVSSSRGHMSKSAEFEEELSLFAGDGEDHRSFMEHRVNPRVPLPNVQLELRCDCCGCSPCLCRARGRSPKPREFLRSPTPPLITSSRRQPSTMGPSRVRKRRDSGIAETFQPPGRQRIPRSGGITMQRMPGAWPEPAESEPSSSSESTAESIPASERSLSPTVGVSRSTSRDGPIFRYTVHPPAPPARSPNPGPSNPPMSVTTAGVAEAVVGTLSPQDVYRRAVCPPTPHNLLTSSRSVTPITVPTARAGDTLMHRMDEESAPGAAKELTQLRGPKMGENVKLSNLQGGDDPSQIPEPSSGPPSDRQSNQINPGHQQVNRQAKGLQRTAAEILMLLSGPLSSGSESPSREGSNRTVLIPTEGDSTVQPKNIIKDAGIMSNMSLESRKDTQFYPAESASIHTRTPSLSSDLQTLSLNRPEHPTTPLSWILGIGSADILKIKENEPVAPRNLSVSSSLKGLRIDIGHEERSFNSGSGFAPILGPSPHHMLLAENDFGPQYTDRSSSAPILPNAPRGRNVPLNARELIPMDDEDDGSSIDSLPATPTEATPVMVKLREVGLEDGVGEEHTRSSLSFHPGQPNASPRQLADEVMDRPASPPSSFLQPPPAPRLRNSSLCTDRTTSAMTLQSPRRENEGLNVGGVSLFTPLLSHQPPRDPLPRDSLPSYEDSTAHPPLSRQSDVCAPSNMPEDYVEQVLAKWEDFSKKTERSSRRHRPRRRPKVPKQPADDLYERAWDEKVSPFVYLWQRRRNRQLANKSRSPDRYFSGVSASAGKSSISQSLNKLFDKYREDATNNPDIIGTTGTMQYLTELGIALDEPAVLAILTELAAPTMGELGREGFVQGWAALKCETMQKQQSSLALIRKRLSEDMEFFRRVYKYTFLLARQPGQKGVQLDTALDFWRLLLSQGGFRWKDNHTDWLELYVEFLNTKWRKSINKDLWDQTGVFAQKTLEDGSMGWWSEDGAWPGVIDDFVAFVRERRGDGERMVE
ncbi:Scaffold-type E3 ligase [Trapelia coarctata]|nr:Scaffold-type E3 ligase [Trapelia coarctata]